MIPANAHRLLFPVFVACYFGAVASASEAGATPGASLADAEPVSVTVNIEGNRIRVKASVLFSAPRERVWAVITDYEKMPRFVSNLVSSEVIERTEQRVLVHQKGKASLGPINFEFDSEREITLLAPEMAVSQLLRGNLKSYNATTILRQEGSGTRLSFTSEASTDAFIPPIIGKRFIENESREQFTEIRTEVNRRQQENAPPS